MTWLTNTSMAAGMQTAQAHTEALKAQLTAAEHLRGGQGDGGDGDGPKRPRRRWFARWRRPR
jgi:hypothetical protein